ncbi:MAG: ferredoxin [Actinomycetota bacterium]|nr:ferredoxin [Actinomycetota bacterium]
MKVRIDADLCTGHGRCYSVAPELFEPNDEDGYGQVVGDGTISDDQQALATKAVNNCPERAIVVEG